MTSREEKFWRDLGDCVDAIIENSHPDNVSKMEGYIADVVYEYYDILGIINEEQEEEDGS